MIILLVPRLKMIRMEAALAELTVEEVNEAEEDIDFINDKGEYDLLNTDGVCLILHLDEEDVFESDFASTDDEAAAEDVDTGEKAVEDEERRARRVCIYYSLPRNILTFI
jgi:hypothetical protein